MGDIIGNIKSVHFTGTTEFEGMRKMYVKHTDAFGCMGILRVSEGKAIFYFDGCSLNDFSIKLLSCIPLCIQELLGQVRMKK